MVSNSSVMNRVKMFERTSSPAGDNGVSPSPEHGRQMPRYGRNAPASEPPKWQQRVAVSERNAYSPVVRGKGTGLFSEPQTGWPSPETNKSGTFLPSPQMRSQSRASPSPAQNGVLGTREPTLSSAKPSPVYVNRRSPQPEAVFRDEDTKQAPFASGWSSPRTRSEKKSVPLKYTAVSSRTSPAASFLQDENEAPVSRRQHHHAFGSSPPHHSPKRATPDSDAISSSDTMSSIGSLSRNLKDASVVMQDEKESIASGSTSARSALSVDELSSIALRALRASREEEKKQPPPDITTKSKGVKSPRRRRQQIQKLSQNAKAKAKLGPSKETNEPKAEASKAKPSSTRISVVSSGTVSSTEKSAAQVSVVSHGKSILPDKKARNQLFETARQRNRSPSPLTVASSSSDTIEKATRPSKPHPESTSASRMAILVAGRRRLGAGSSSPGLSRSFSSQSRPSTIDANSSDDATVSTQETTSSRKASRMALLAAAHRHSPVPTAMNKIVDSANAKSQPQPQKTSTTEPYPRRRPANGRSRGARMVALSSTTKGTPMTQAMKSKTDGTNKPTLDKKGPAATSKKDVGRSSRSPARSKITEAAVSRLLPPEAGSSSVSKPVKVKPEMESRPKTETRKFNSETTKPRSAFSSPKPSPTASPAVEPKPRVYNRSPGKSSLGRASRISDHPAMRAKRGSPGSSPYRSPKRIDSLGDKKSPFAEKRPRRMESKSSSASTAKDTSDRRTEGQENTGSDISGSTGGVKAAIDAFTSKSNEIRHENAVLTSPKRIEVAVSSPVDSSPQGNRSVHSRETKQSDGSPNTYGEGSNGISSEVSVGGSHATFFSSPSSHASSKMSVGAPGSFFRPMGNDFEDQHNDNLLGQLSGNSTDDSTLPSHLFNTSNAERAQKNEDSELSFLLQQMKSESDSEDSGIILLQAKEPAPVVVEEDDDEDSFDQHYDIETGSEEQSKATNTTLNEPSTLLGQSLVESESSDNRQPSAVQPALDDQTGSSDSSDSRFIKWWQKTDPEKRRKKFESYPAPPARPYETNFRKLAPMLQQDEDDDDLFSGLSYDDEPSQGDVPFQENPLGSFGDDIFSGVAASVDSRANSVGTHSTNPSIAFPPPPPPPPLESNTVDQFGTILVHGGSHAVDSVGSDITSSVLGNDAVKDWSRREATAVITEELTADLEDEEDTTIESDRRQKEASVLSGNSRVANDPEPIALVGPDNAEEALEIEEASAVASDVPKGNSIFMSLGCGALEPLSAFCSTPAGKDGLSLAGSQSLTANDDGTASHTLPSTLNEYEQKVWEDWNRQDNEPNSPATSPAAKSVSSEVVERRENAHRQLVEYAESAKSASDKERESSTAEDIEPTSTLSESSASDKSHHDSSPKEPIETPKSAFSASQRRILEKFSSTLKLNAMEVLKLNRDKKWQTRFLVVSKEVLWLNAADVNGLSGDRGQCPLGILWTKRFNPSKEYSIGAIDRQGRGGVLFDSLVKVSASGRSDLGHALSKKQQEKFKDSVAISVDYLQNGIPKSVVLLCRTTDAAHFLCTGLRVVIDVLKREKVASDET